MKTTKLIAIGLVSLSAIGLGSAIANAEAIDGDPVSATTNGKVKFSVDKDGDGSITDPGGEDGGTVVPEDKPGGNGNTTDPDLKINFVPNFVFTDATGDETVEYNTQKGGTYQAMKQSVKKYDEDGKQVGGVQEIENFAQIFNSDAIDNWTFTVTAGQFELDGEGSKKQPKMVMSINNIEMATGANNYGTQAKVVGGEGAAKLLTPGQAVEIGSYTDNDGEGAINTFEFNSTADKAGVTLDVPKGLSISNADAYTANLTWTAVSDVK